MTQPHEPGDGRVEPGPDHHPEIDWIAAERSPEFRELIKKKRASSRRRSSTWPGSSASSCSPRRAEPSARFDELYVRSETGLGAEVATGLTLTGKAQEERETTPAAAP